MASRRSRHRRFLLPAVLAAVLFAEITGIALARTLVPAGAAAGAAASPAGAGPATVASGAATVPNGAVVVDPARDSAVGAPTPQRPLAGGLDASSATGTRADGAHAAKTATGSGHATSGRPGAGYHGTNHVWIPSLGINKAIQSFPCSRNRPPDAGIYRWGCAGRNNVYLLGHAWSTFKPLHNAYVRGRLSKGMRVIYADGGGRVHTYAVAWWKVVAPTSAASWAWASLSRPSMTLQTCVGANSQYRLMVRLVELS